MRESGSHTYEFGSFQLDPDERRLLRDGQQVALTPKAFDTLVVLVERAGKLVEKEELISALWPNSFVEEGNLNQNIWTVRKALGETENGQRFIETVSKKGFRFVADVIERSDSSTVARIESPARGDQSTHASRAMALKVGACLLVLGIVGLAAYALIRRNAKTSAPTPKSLAVLPFKPLSADSRNESLEMGMAETLIARLSSLRQIVVRPVNDIRKYNEPQQNPLKAGQELQTDLVLDGSLQKVGDRMRVTVRLTRVADNSTVWAQQFDEKFTDIFKVQDSIAERVANTLPLKLGGDEQQLLTKRYTDNPEAYELFLQGLYYRQRRGPGDREKSQEYYQRAIDKDPKFALAYIEMAELQMSYIGSNQKSAAEMTPSIIENLNKALELDDSLAQGHNLLAEVKYQFDFDWAGGETEFKKAIDLNPNIGTIHLSYGTFLMCEGRFSEATREMDRAREIDPSSLIFNVIKGRLLYFSRQYDAALAHYLRLIELEPNSSVNHWAIAKVYEQKGMYTEAVAETATADHLDGVRLNPEEIAALNEAFRTGGWEGYTQKRIEIIQKPKVGQVPLFSLAAGYADLGDKDRALLWLDKAIEARASGVWSIKIDPKLDSLRSDARFIKLLRKMNLNP